MSEIKWIKCSERLPALIDKIEYKISNYVVGFGNKYVSYFETYHIVRLHEDNKFYTSEGECMQITHWFPLPNKPEGYR